MHKKGVLLCGHGTRVKQGEEAFIAYARRFAAMLPEYEVEAGFLELSEPDFEKGVKNLIERGIEEIIALPVFLFTGVHIQKDIPCILFQLQRKYNVRIQLASYIGDCDDMVMLSNELVSQVASEIKGQEKETLFFGLGVGASKAAANGDLARLTRLVQESNNFSFSINGFCSRMTYPSVGEALTISERLDYKNIVVLPYVFFPGVYMDKALALLDAFKSKHPDKRVLVTSLLSESSALSKILMKRLHSIEEGEADLISRVDKETLENYEPHHHHHHGHACNGHHH
ncbi:sirohydrochlorin chelatase [Carboxylicivirga sp. M1479]|uniref:sirohydrochlorin chelatase n=1 Tax=Carboxylicivirga sp. M1479 TaxID=2594476 RepID=UPI0011785D98|nr:sirohydrochlorin chelatase [Carboxylicivirga sp. M1479]TRX70219.1 sirohydrochlorin chelatase [Carboxylicivirga sp. M1479]